MGKGITAITGLNPDQRKRGKRFRRGGTGLNPDLQIPDPTSGLGPDYHAPDRDITQSELWKQSPAMALANDLLNRGPVSAAEHARVLRKMGVPDDAEPTLADRFIHSTYTLGRAVDRARDRKRIDDIMMHPRIAMRKAHRFVLDNDFVRYATQASTVPAEKLLARLQYATLPYETTWIEFDLHAKVQAVREIHKVNNDDYTQIGQRLGYLLERLDDTTAVATLVSQTADTADMHLLSYYFSSVEQLSWPRVPGLLAMDRKFMQTKDHEDVADHIDGGMWGYTKDKSHGMLNVATGGGFESLNTPSFLRHHGCTATNRLFEMYRTVWGESGMPDEQLTRIVKTEITEFSGHMRWLVTVLAMLNEVPVHADVVMPSHQQRVGPTKKVKFVDYHKLTLRLPKLRPLPFIERHISGDVERRHRAHEVRAHWRTYLHAEHCKRDEHDWTYDRENGYRLCGKCMAYSRLIHEHVRGDATLGWVRKDYVIKKETSA